MLGKKVLYLFVMVCMLLGSVGLSFADENPIDEITTKLDTAYVSKYIWRGNVLNPDPAFQPSLTFSIPNGLSYNLWASMDMTDVIGQSSNITEVDHTLSYAWDYKSVGMTSGYVYYAFPNTTFLSTSEIFASACFGGKFSPTISVNYDVDEVQGAYFGLGGGYACSMPWSKVASSVMNFTAKVGYGTASYNKAYFYGSDKSAFTDLALSASVPFQAGKVGITPSVGYSTVLDGTLRDALADNQVDSDNLFGGLAMSVEF